MNHSDGDLATRVTSALLEDVAWRGIIDVTCTAGVVSLAGIAASEQSRQAAEAIVRQQAGVVTVINKLDLSDRANQSATRHASVMMPLVLFEKIRASRFLSKMRRSKCPR